MSELTKKNLQTEIEKALTAKGLMEGAGQTDLNIFYTFGAARRVETETYPAGWRGLRTRVARVPYNEGTLVIDLRDPKTRSLVWRGVASDSESNPAKISAKLDDMVEKGHRQISAEEITAGPAGMRAVVAQALLPVRCLP